MTVDGKLIHGGQLVRRWNHAGTPPIENGALYEEGGRIVAIGRYDELQRRYPDARRIGGPDCLVVPGFVNSHAHGRGVTTHQLDQLDAPLEMRLIEFFYRGRTGNASVQNSSQDPYRDTLYACAKQIASGITTTLHSHQYLEGNAETYAAATRPVLDAYRDSGIRCAFTLGIRDRNTFTFQDDADFIAALPAGLRDAPALRSTCDMGIDAFLALMREFAAAYPTITMQLGPWNPVFCSDDLLTALADASRRDGWRVQTHLNETRHQAAYGRRLHGRSWVKRLDEIGLLSARFSGAHGIWLDDGDIEILARAGAQIVYNPGSNMRLQSGLSPVRAFLEGGVKVGFGLDSLSMNDDDDMLQDLRLGRMIQSGWGVDGALIPAEAMLEMATANGATVTGIAGIGTLSEGGHADVVLLSRRDIDGAPNRHAPADAILKRGRAAHVRTVVIGGRVMIEDGKWAGRAPAEWLAELTASGMLANRGDVASMQVVQDAVRRHLRQHDA